MDMNKKGLYFHSKYFDSFQFLFHTSYVRKFVWVGFFFFFWQIMKTQFSKDKTEI